jgi:hypothetical protein
MRPAIFVALISLLSTGCIGFVSSPNAGYYRGGGIGLFVIIFVAAIIFGKKRR